jgi:putative phage-type endonuclease
MLSSSDKYLKSLQVTQQDVLHVMNIPQRTPEWHKWRVGRLTASNFGSAVSHNPRSSSKYLLKELLWNTFKGNAATEYGNMNESNAVKIYEQFIKKTIRETIHPVDIQFYYPGLIICQEHPWLAVSPDGLPNLIFKNSNTQTRFLLEIKCPFSKKLYPYIPHYYYDQIQGIMGILQLPFCDFVVWTPEKTQIRRYNFNKNYWNEFLFPKLREFYMQEYLPRLILKEEGKLSYGNIDQVTESENPELLFDWYF